MRLTDGQLLELKPSPWWNSVGGVERSTSRTEAGAVGHQNLSLSFRAEIERDLHGAGPPATLASRAGTHPPTVCRMPSTSASTHAVRDVSPGYDTTPDRAASRCDRPGRSSAPYGCDRRRRILTPGAGRRGAVKSRSISATRKGKRQVLRPHRRLRPRVDRSTRRRCSTTARASSSRSCPSAPHHLSSDSLRLKTRRRHPARAAQPGRQGPAPLAAVPGDEADDRVRRHLAAAAKMRRPDIRQRASKPCSTWRGGPARRRALMPRSPCTAHDGVRAAPRRRRPALRRSSAPRACCTTHAEDPMALAFLGETAQGEESRSQRRRVRPVDLREHQTSARWRRLEVRRDRACVVQVVATTHNVKTMQHSKSFMDQNKSELHSSNWRMAGAQSSGREVFPRSRRAEQRHVPSPVRLPAEAGVGWTPRTPHVLARVEDDSTATPSRLRRSIFQSIEAPHNMTVSPAMSGRAQADDGEGVEQQLVRSRDRPTSSTMGLRTSAVQRPLDHETRSRGCLGLGYFFNLYPAAAGARGRPC